VNSEDPSSSRSPQEQAYFSSRREIASQLRINQHCIDTSYNFFKMSVSRNLTRGRVRYVSIRNFHKTLHIYCSTLVNMFDLGRTLNFLSRSLRINLPSTDPCLYIMRFACLMEFGEKQKEVVNLATRLVQRMKRDWMSMGRRPTGLCGAALLLAARSYNFNRTISDVVKVVHISESVVRKRLDEFSKTPSSALTIDEFSTVDLEHEEDPPAFRESRRKAREEQLAREAEMTELERALEKKRREKFRHTRYAKIVAGEIDDPEVGRAEETTTSPDFSKYAPSLQSLGISKQNSSICESPVVDSPLPPQDRPDGIDDDEIDTYILTEAESAMKERFWMKLNGEHLKEMERKFVCVEIPSFYLYDTSGSSVCFRRKEREEEEEKEKDNPSKKKRKRVQPHRQNLASNTAIEAMEKIIHVSIEILSDYLPNNNINRDAENLSTLCLFI
ncbi:unnamed protein product, partial [Heligmosomoides polygyrus]|uniref:CYCLIN domain-containing protein n=1 Tax=Heligmosomoides polygyrus TaxID=6339 RepID=A0A183F641_HELPZ